MPARQPAPRRRVPVDAWLEAREATGQPTFPIPQRLLVWDEDEDQAVMPAPRGSRSEVTARHV